LRLVPQEQYQRRRPDCGSGGIPMRGACHTTTLIVVTLVTVLSTLQTGASHADETADIGRILELNDAYAESSRARRAGEIALYEVDRQYPANSAQRTAYEQAKVAWRRDGEFVREGTDVLAKGLSERRANAILDRIGEYLNAQSLQPGLE